MCLGLGNTFKHIVLCQIEDTVVQCLRQAGVTVHKGYTLSDWVLGTKGTLDRVVFRSDTKGHLQLECLALFCYPPKETSWITYKGLSKEHYIYHKFKNICRCNTHITRRTLWRRMGGGGGIQSCVTRRCIIIVYCYCKIKAWHNIGKCLNKKRWFLCFQSLAVWAVVVVVCRNHQWATNYFTCIDPF